MLLVHLFWLLSLIWSMHKCLVMGLIGTKPNCSSVVHALYLLAACDVLVALCMLVRLAKAAASSAQPCLNTHAALAASNDAQYCQLLFPVPQRRLPMVVARCLQQCSLYLAGNHMQGTIETDSVSQDAAGCVAPSQVCWS